MEQYAFNGTTTKDQAWKEKKGFAPLIMLTALLLGLAFYAGQMSSGSTVATRGGVSASMMSSDAFESMMSGTQDCDEACCLRQKCNPSSATSCGAGIDLCHHIVACIQTPSDSVYRCQLNYIQTEKDSDAFESGTQDDCGGNHICNPKSATDCGKGLSRCMFTACILQTPEDVYRCQAY